VVGTGRGDAGGIGQADTDTGVGRWRWVLPAISLALGIVAGAAGASSFRRDVPPQVVEVEKVVTVEKVVRETVIVEKEVKRPVTVTPASGEPAAYATRIWDVDGSVMVEVPAGEFLMGSDGDPNALADEYPQRAVYLDAFWIDQTEVTNEQFAAFLNEQGNQTEGGVARLDLEDVDSLVERVDGTFRPRSGYVDHPVIEVSWFGAAAYCQWVGKRLPSEAEWEKAARGADARIYPWGDQWDFARANTDEQGPGRTSPVGSYPSGTSPHGALDMAGNVWEWVADWYDGDHYGQSPDRNPTGPPSGNFRVLRGGAWSRSYVRARSANRNASYPVRGDEGLGFRCAAHPASSSSGS
jgi:formylglycine-generating enzyme required for sulfatase activity